MDERISFGLYQSCGNRWSVRRLVCMCLGCGGVGVVERGLDQSLGGWVLF